jgi:4-amino-4-deoxy-L-arabinose transferase-like glycosyltransferase
MMPPRSKGVAARYALAALLLAIPLFVHLGDQVIRLWDESRLAMNAWEMHASGKFMLLQFGGEPDMWNTKPPLVIWMQTACISLFGFSEFSVRLPSALSALATCMALIFLADRRLGDFRTGAMAALILVSMSGFNGYHVARTADFDAPLILFLVLSFIAVFWYTEERKPGSAFMACIFTGLAVLAKGVAGLFFLPGILVYLLWSRQFVPLLKERGFWAGCLLAAAVIAALYGIREHLSPGYLQAVFENELGGRYFEVNEGHSGSFFYYLKPIFSNYWMIFFPAAFLPLLEKEKSGAGRLAVFAWITSALFLLVISSARTKLAWYAAPVYPLMAILLALGFKSIAGRLAIRRKVSQTRQVILFVIIAVFPVLAAVHPLNNLMRQQTNRMITDGHGDIYEMSHYMKDALKQGYDLGDLCFLRDRYQPHIDFYLIRLDAKGLEPQACTLPELEPGARVLYWEDEVERKLEDAFQVNILSRQGNVREALIGRTGS